MHDVCHYMVQVLIMFHYLLNVIPEQISYISLTLQSKSHEFGNINMLPIFKVVC
jgi:hypothetical protein